MRLDETQVETIKHKVIMPMSTKVVMINNGSASVKQNNKEQCTKD